MHDIMNKIKKAREGKPYGKQYIPDSISDVTPSAEFNYIGNFNSLEELYSLPEKLKKNHNVATITGIDGCFYYLNHLWIKFGPVSPDDDARITGLQEFCRCIRSMLEFTCYQWDRFEELTEEYNIKPKPSDLFNASDSINDVKSSEIVAELVNYTDPIVLYNAYIHYTNKIEEKINDIKSKRIDEIGNMMISFDISEDDIHEWIKHFNNEDAPDEAIEEDQKDKDPRFKWEQSADCTKCRRRYACVPRDDVQSLVKVHGCRGFTLDKSR